MLNKKIAVIGAGNMGGAIIKGLLSSKLALPGNIIASDRDKRKLRAFRGNKIKTAADNIEAVRRGDVIILCVKPKDMDEVLGEISGYRLSLRRRLFITIAAGIKTSFIEKRLGEAHVIRVMPNTPALAGEGVSAVCRGRFAAPEDEKIARIIFGGIGCTVKFEERDMDAVTALSGSGPAYFFFLMEALLEAGKRMGIAPEKTLALTLQTALGAAVLAKESGISPDKLRQMVTSKGGTTEAAFEVLKKNRVKDTIIKAVISAMRRSQELGE